jgi:hypothetical protein
MIGVESPNNAKLFYNFSLEKKVRKNHPLRKLKEILNLDFMYGLLKDKYGYNGNVSGPLGVPIAPRIFLRQARRVLRAHTQGRKVLEELRDA